MADTKLRDSVLRELKWEPQVDTAHIGVSAHNGAVTLAGHVSSYPEKGGALNAVERVYGIGAVADKLEVELLKAKGATRSAGSLPGKADRDGPRARARHADVILFVGRRRRLGRMNVGT
jgi:hypothetical protein